MTFGATTLVDLLSWIAATLLAIKLAATLVLLAHGEARGGLWWCTKIAPLVAVPCMIAIALIERSPAELWTYAALMAFVLVAVPAKILRRVRRAEPR